MAEVDGRIEIELPAADVSGQHGRGLPRVEASEEVPGLTDDVRAVIDAPRR